MDHATTRAILVPEIVKLISEKYQIPEMDALDLFGKISDTRNGRARSVLHLRHRSQLR